MLHAAAKMIASAPIEVVPKRRGLHTLGQYQLSTSFPFGFIKRATELVEKDTLLVLPAIGRVDKRLLSMCRSAEKTGAVMRPRRGGQDEFYGVKEYRSGENPNLIYWRRSARTGVLVSKEMTQVAPPRLVILVDTFLPQRSAELHTDVEMTIAMAASMLSEAMEANMAVGLAAWDQGWVLAPPQRGKRHRLDLLGILARLTLNSVASAQELMDEAHSITVRGATPILFSPRPAEVALGDHLRSGLIVLSPASPVSRKWFHFDPAIDFSRCMPPDQQPGMPAKLKMTMS
jgi:uncharacterized protein (DUF58 family)